MQREKNIRFCLDYRRLNAITKRDVYPLPRVDDALAFFILNILKITGFIMGFFLRFNFFF
jgi:hypothetical protein